MLDLYHIAMSVNPELNILYRGWTFTLYQHCKLVIKININDFGLFCYWNFTSEKCCDINIDRLKSGCEYTKKTIHSGVDNVHWLCCA